MSRWQKGHQLAGRFVVEGWLASGGMAEVYVAEMTLARGVRRRVALKRIHVHLAEDPSATAMFLDEARLISQLVHPGVTPVHDVIEHEGELIIVLDYVPGWDLGAVVKTAREKQVEWPIELAVSIAQELLRTLAYVHEARDVNGRALALVHRDVNPSNILLAEDGSVRLLDFGIAKATARFTKTLSRAIKGKLSYLAPEQAEGAADARTDLYAVGLVLFELIAGRRALDVEGELDLLDRLRDPQIPPLRSLREGVPAQLEKFVSSLLALDPAQRPQNAQVAAAELEALHIRGATPEVLSQFVEQQMGTKRREPKGARSALEQALLDEARVAVAAGTKAAKAKQVDAVPPTELLTVAPRSRAPLIAALTTVAVGAIIATVFYATRSEDRAPIIATPIATSTRAVIAEQTPAPVIVETSTPSEPAPVIRYGSLDVSAMPWAKVIVDGKTVAESTPVLGLRLPEGEHTVRLVNPRLKRSVTRRVRISASRREQLIVDLR